MILKTNVRVMEPQEKLVILRDRLRDSRKPQAPSPQDQWALNEILKSKRAARMWGCVFLFMFVLTMCAVVLLICVAEGGKPW